MCKQNPAAPLCINKSPYMSIFKENEKKPCIERFQKLVESYGRLVLKSKQRKVWLKQERKGYK
jgi:hypothetical protein